VNYIIKGGGTTVGSRSPLWHVRRVTYD